MTTRATASDGRCVTRSVVLRSGTTSCSPLRCSRRSSSGGVLPPALRRRVGYGPPGPRYLVGRIAERRGWHRYFQANTERTRRVVSLVYLARGLLRSPLHRRMFSRDVVREVRRIRTTIRELAA